MKMHAEISCPKSILNEIRYTHKQARKKEESEWACKPGFVLSGQIPERGNHFSTMTVTCHLEQPTRKETEADRLRPLFRANSLLFGLAPDGVYQARPVTWPAGELLPHRFTLTSRQEPAGGLFSAALSLTLRLVGVTHHRILRSPDFPLARMFLVQKLQKHLER